MTGTVTLSMKSAAQVAPGGEVGIFALSAQVGPALRDRFWHSVRAIEHFFGRKVRVPGHIHNSLNGNLTSQQRRADETNELLKDRSIVALISAFGGTDTIDALNQINLDSFARKPKPLIGYSDTTSLLIAAGAVAPGFALYGPALLPQFGENPFPLSATLRSLNAALLGNIANRDVGPWDTLLRPDPDWSPHLQRSSSRNLDRAPGASVLQPGCARGHLWGGNVETLCAMIDTKWWPSPVSPIVFLETTGTGRDNQELLDSLSKLKRNGLFSSAAAVILGYTTPYLAHGLGALEAIAGFFKDYAFPIVVDLPFGHLDPVATLPIGSTVKLHAICKGRNAVQIQYE